MTGAGAATEAGGEADVQLPAINTMLVAQLRQELSARGLDTKGKKAELVKRLQAHRDLENTQAVQATEATGEDTAIPDTIDAPDSQKNDAAQDAGAGEATASQDVDADEAAADRDASVGEAIAEDSADTPPPPLENVVDGDEDTSTTAADKESEVKHDSKESEQNSNSPKESRDRNRERERDRDRGRQSDRDPFGRDMPRHRPTSPGSGDRDRGRERERERERERPRNRPPEPARRRAASPPPNSRLFLGNLPSERVTKPDVKRVFAKYGKVLEVVLLKSFGFVQFDNPQSAQEAIRGEKNLVLAGMALDVSLASNKGERKTRRKLPRGAPGAFPRMEHPGARGPMPGGARGPMNSLLGAPDPAQLEAQGLPRPALLTPPENGPGRGAPRGRPSSREVNMRSGSPPFKRPYEDVSGRESAKRARPAAKEVELVVLSPARDSREFADVLGKSLAEVGLSVGLSVLSPRDDVRMVLNEMSRDGVLYACIIKEIQSYRGTATIKFLYPGAPTDDIQDVVVAEAVQILKRDINRVRKGGRPSLGPHGAGRADPSTHTRDDNRVRDPRALTSQIWNILGNDGESPTDPRSTRRDDRAVGSRGGYGTRPYPSADPRSQEQKSLESVPPQYARGMDAHHSRGTAPGQMTDRYPRDPQDSYAIPDNSVPGQGYANERYHPQRSYNRDPRQQGDTAAATRDPRTPSDRRSESSSTSFGRGAPRNVPDSGRAQARSHDTYSSYNQNSNPYGGGGHESAPVRSPAAPQPAVDPRAAHAPYTRDGSAPGRDRVQGSRYVSTDPRQQHRGQYDQDNKNTIPSSNFETPSQSSQGYDEALRHSARPSVDPRSQPKQYSGHTQTQDYRQSQTNRGYNERNTYGQQSYAPDSQRQSYAPESNERQGDGASWQFLNNPDVQSKLDELLSAPDIQHILQGQGQH